MTPTQSSPAIGDADAVNRNELADYLADIQPYWTELDAKSSGNDFVEIGTLTRAERDLIVEALRTPTPSPASGERDAEKQITWLKSSLVAILTLCKSDTPPTYASLAEIIERALDKADSLSSTTAGGKVTGPPDDYPEQLKSAVAKDVF